MGPITGSNRIQHNPPKKTTNRDQLKGPGFLRDQGKGSAKGFIFHSPKKRPTQKTNFYKTKKKTKKKDQKKDQFKRPTQKTNSPELWKPIGKQKTNSPEPCLPALSYDPPYAPTLSPDLPYPHRPCAPTLSPYPAVPPYPVPPHQPCQSVSQSVSQSVIQSGLLKAF